MGSHTNTSTSTSAPANSDVTATISKLSKGLANEYTPGKSLFQQPGATTQAGWAASLGAADNPDYANSLRGALGDYGDIAAGKRFGTDDPGYAALRAKLSDDVMTTTNTAFNNSGLFGSDSNQKAAASGLADSLGALDYGNLQNDRQRQDAATAMLPQIFSALQLPSSVQQSVGASQDAAAQGAANGPTDYLAKLTSILNGNAASAGTTTTSSTPGTPLWQTLLGLGVSAL